MPIKEVSCFLCGALIDESAHLPEWMGRFRALYTVLQDWGAARISGVGRRQLFEDVIPLDQSINVDVSESTIDDCWVQISLMKSSFGGKYPPDPPMIPQPLWGFPLHDHCWDLLCAADPHFRDQSNVQALFDLCRSQPIQRGVLNWGHSYNGLVNYDVDPEKLLPGEEARLQGGELADGAHRCDPMEIPRLGRITSSDVDINSTRSHGTDQKLSSMASTNSDPLRFLPPELLVDILVRSNSRAVANLRLASKFIASIGLPDIFWCSRFWRGREFEHIFELASCQTAQGRWRFIYDQIQASWGIPAMQNRLRVWSLACRLGDLVALRLESPRCHGSLCQSYFDPNASKDDRTWHTAESAIYPADTIFSQGSRSLYDSKITITGRSTGAWASLVRLNGKTYVSGLRFSQSSGDAIQIGYHHPQHEVSFLWNDCPEPLDLFVGFVVAVDARGIRGLRVLSNKGRQSCWVGDHEAVPKKSVYCVDSRNGQTEVLQDVKAGFDALKLVSLSVHGPHHDNEKSDRQEIKANSGESALWYPELPDPALRVLTVRDQRLSRYVDHVPYSMCLFGGRDGQLLPYLTDIIVWVIDRSALGIHADRTYIWAIEFHYDGPTDGFQSMTLGQIPDPDSDTSERQRYHIPIDSRNGERISGVDAMYEDPRSPFALTLYMSRGRVIRIPTDFTSIVQESDFFTESSRPSEGTIVGFFSVLKHNLVFQNLGVAYIPSHSSRM